MALIPGSVRVAGFIAPTDTTDTYAVTDETYNRGGYRTVTDLAARNAITADRRKEGMLVRLSTTGDTYVLIGGILDANWTLVSFGGSGSATLEVASTAEGATTPNPGVPKLIWSTITGTLLVWNGTSWISVVSDIDLQALANLTTTGFVVRTGSGTVASRQILGTPGQIQVADGDGLISSPVIALVNTAIVPGTYTKVTVDQQGRATSGTTLIKSDIPEDYLSLYKENYVGGSIASATGTNSVAIGNGASAQSNNSIALGEYSVSRHTGAVMQSAGRFVVSGDAQIGSYILKAVTTTNMARQMYLDGPTGTTALTIPDNSTWTFKITVTAHRSDVNDGHAGYLIKGVIYRGSGVGTTAMQGFTNVEIISRSNPSWTINTTADNVNGCLAITVSGESSKTIRWLAHIETVEITG
jgi:hypothetical protein